MKRLAIVICLGTTSLLAAQRQPPLFAITRVTLIDGTGTAAQADTNVIVSGGRIIAIGPSARTPVPRGAQNIDGRGKFLIPGLWDMHAHPFLAEAVVPANVFLDSYLANGVTTIRDPAGPLGRQVAMRAATARAERAGPRLIVSGPVLDGPAPIWPGVSIAVGAEDAAMTAVATVAGGGADFVKVYDFLPRPAYLAVVAEAKRRKLPFAGHVPIAVTAAEASDAGQVSIEHLIRLFESCSSEELDLQRESLAIVARATSTGTLENTPLVLRDLFHIELRAEKSYDAA